jgi:hypothetical protein
MKGMKFLLLACVNSFRVEPSDRHTIKIIVNNFLPNNRKNLYYFLISLGIYRYTTRGRRFREEWRESVRAKEKHALMFLSKRMTSGSFMS